MKSFDVRAAYLVGVVLPLLETLRRRTDFSSIAFYVDDFIAGGLLFCAARAVSHRHPRGRAGLIAAWGILCGGIYGSFFGQLEALGSTDVSGLPAGTVAVAKGIVFAIASVALACSVLRGAAGSGAASAT